MPTSFAELLRQYEAAGRVGSYTVPKKPRGGMARMLLSVEELSARKQRKEQEAEEKRKIVLGRRRVEQERSLRIQQLGLTRFKRFEEISAPAGRRRFLRGFKEEQEQIARDKTTIKQQGRLELEAFKQQGRAEFEVFKRELTFEDRVRKARTDEILNQFRAAQTQKIISAPKFERYKSDLSRIEEGDKAKNRMQLEALQQANKETTEELKQQHRAQLATYKAQLKPPKESPMQEYMRFRNTGAFRTVRDIAVYWAAKGRKGTALREITEMSAAQMGLAPEETTFWTGAPERFKEFLDVPLPSAVANQQASHAIEQYGSRQAAEMSLKSVENQLRRTAHEAGQETPIDMDADIAAKMEEFSRKWPEQPSTYDRMDTYNPAIEVTGGEKLEWLGQGIGDLFEAGRSEVQDIADTAVNELTGMRDSIDDYLKEEAKKRKKPATEIGKFIERGNIELGGGKRRDVGRAE